MAIALRGTPTVASSSRIITAPTGVQATDLLVCCFSADGPVTFPSPWVVWRSFFGGHYHHIATLAWTSGTTWSPTGANFFSNVCAAYSGVDLGVVFSAENIAADGGASSSVVSPTITNPAGNWILSSYSGQFGSPTATPAGYTLRGNGTSGSQSALADSNGPIGAGSVNTSWSTSFASGKSAWIGSLKPAPTTNPAQFFAMF
jgi:hypothetical protein